MPKETVEGIYKLDRDKVLDEAIFLALVGLNNLRVGSKITGLIRLETAKVKLDAIIEKLKKEQ